MKVHMCFNNYEWFELFWSKIAVAQNKGTFSSLYLKSQHKDMEDRLWKSTS